MKKDQLQNFIDVVQYGSINKASEQLYITQPSLSRSIQALETEMGKELFIRTSKGVTLTPTGRIFYNYALSIIHQFEALERLKNLDEEIVFSKLSVSVDSLFLKDNTILRFYEKMHSIEAEIHLLETTGEEVLAHVAEGRSEFGITILNDYQLKICRKMADLKELALDVHGQSSIYIHAYEESELAEHETVKANQLLHHIYIHLPHDFIGNLNNSLEVDELRLSDISRSLSMSNYHAIIKMLRSTDSFLIGHKWQIEELAKAHVKSMLLENCDIQNNFVVIRRKREIFSPAAQTFLDILKEDYKDF